MKNLSTATFLQFPANMKRIILSCMVGNALEWYDFALYICFGSMIGRLFFPSSDPYNEWMLTYGVFAAGFIARPLGAILFGYIGDRLGRKKSLMLSIYFMAIPTALIGILPTYQQIGPWAGVLMTVLRISQGLAVGGEFTGAMVFLVEHSPTQQKSFSGSFAPFSLALGFTLGSLTAAIIMGLLTTSQVETWGWRLPFLLSVLGTFIGTYIRRRLSDPEEFLKLKQARKQHSSPLRDLFRQYWPTILLVLWIDLLTAVGYYLLTSFLPNYLSQYLAVDKSPAFIISTANMMILAASTLIGGVLSDRFGERRIMSLAAWLLAILSYPTFVLLHTYADSAILINVLLAPLFVAFGLFFGPIPIALCHLFPIHVRFTGLAVSHNLAMTLFGGTAPLFALYLMKTFTDTTLPALMLACAALLSALGLRFLPKRDEISTTASQEAMATYAL